MGWRIVCIEEALRLNYKLNNIGILKDDQTVWISLDEIDLIIIESLRCNTSIKLLKEICEKGISVVICGDNHMPIGVLNSINDNQRTAKINKMQLDWSKEMKRLMWQAIIKHKIYLQMSTLFKLNKTDKLQTFREYIDNVELGDVTNVEGRAAKVYFHQLFGNDFQRTQNADDLINSSLNYMYQVVRAKIAQEIVAHGYLPTVGIFHCSEYNYFGLADDIIELYRPIIDFYVVKKIQEQEANFLGSTLKEILLNIMYEYILLDNKKITIFDSIRLVTISVTDCLSKSNIESIKLPDFYE